MRSKGAFFDKISDNFKDFDETVLEKIKEASKFATDENED
jgi:hypothetical protein